MIQQQEKLHIHLYHKLPTPYNDMLFRALDADSRVELDVYHLWKSRGNRPWTVKLATGYRNHYLDTKILGIDFTLLKKAITEHDSFFLIGDWAHVSSIVVLIARILTKSPVAIWADTPQEHLPRPWYKKAPRKLFLSWLLPRMNIVFGTGNPGTRTLKEMGVPETKVADLPCFVDLDLPAICKRNQEMIEKSQKLRDLVGCSDDGVIFLMSGMCTYKKGHDIGIKAFAQLLDQNKDDDIGLLIAGDGAQRQELEVLAKKLGVYENIAFLGWLNPDDMSAAYLASDVVVHPSRWDQFPLVILEGMSWGKVVIGSNACGSVQDRIVSGENGYSFPNEDIQALIEKMAKVVHSAELRQLIGSNARATAELWPVQTGVETIIQTAQQIIESKK